MEQTLTIGMAHHNDYHGVYFSIQDIRKELIFNKRYDLLKKINFLIIENDPTSKHAEAVKQLEFKIPNLKVIDYTDKNSTSASRNKIIEEALSTFVLVMDCHVFLCPVVETLDRLFTFMEYNPKTNDLYSGPLVHDDMGNFSTHFSDDWGAGMWGQWSCAWQCVCENYHFSVYNRGENKAGFRSLELQENIDKCVYCDRGFPLVDYAGHEKVLSSQGYSKVGTQNHEKPLEIFAQGLGMFLTRKISWLKFNANSDGFGGEECYIHTKYRQNNRKCYNLPFLKWLHRFGRPDGVQYTLTIDNKIKNYIHEFTELNLDITPVKNHFVNDQGFSESAFNKLHEECAGNKKCKPNPKEVQLLQHEVEAFKRKVAEASNGRIKMENIKVSY
jgi:hypothetical protein